MPMSVSEQNKHNNEILLFLCGEKKYIPLIKSVEHQVASTSGYTLQINAKSNKQTYYTKKMDIHIKCHLTKKYLVFGHEVGYKHIGSVQVVHNISWLKVVGFAEVVSPCNPNPYSLILMFLHLNGNLQKKNQKI